MNRTNTNDLRPLRSIEERNSLAPKTERQAIMRRIGVLVVGGAVLLGGAFGIHNATKEEADRPTVTYVAKPGDNLWNIAQRIDGDVDLRDMVEQLEAQRIELGDPQPDVVSIGETFQVDAASPLGQQVSEELEHKTTG